MTTPKNPGPWQLYATRLENRGLTANQLYTKYLYESMWYQQHIQYLLAVQAAAGSGGALSIDPSENLFVENDYIDDYFE